MNFITIKWFVSLIIFFVVVYFYFRLGNTVLKKDNFKRLYVFCSIVMEII